MTSTWSDTERGSQLYAAAVELFMARGYRDVDVAEIAAAAGTSHGTFYNYFRNKRDVLTAIQEATEAEMLEVVSAGEPDVEPLDVVEFVDEFRARITRAIGYFVDYSEFMSFIVLTAAGVDDESLAAALTTYQRLAAQFTALLRHGHRRGWVHDDLDLDVAGQAAVSAIVTSVLPVLTNQEGQVDVEHASAVCTSYLLHGMRGLPDAR